MHKKEKAQTLKNNVKYLIKSRGETQLSLCNASGLTRTTIYNILEGRVTNVQQTTIRKISDFFGVSYKEIESVNLEEREIVESSASLHGNMNPAAVPIIKESELVQNLNKRIGQLVIECPLTYYFGVVSNLIGVLLENDIKDMYEAGALLVVKKGVLNGEGEKLIYKQSTKELLINTGGCPCSDVLVIGDVVEERFNGR